MTLLPDLIEPLSYEAILEANTERVKNLLPGYTPSESDNVMLVLQAFSYREKVLREFINSQVRQLFLSTAEGAYLDHLAETYYGLYRLNGSKPYATATLSLSMALEYDVFVPKGYQLTEDGGIYFSHTTADVTIPAGQTSVDVTIELDKMVASSKVRTEILVTPLPFLEVKQEGDFLQGGDLESDEEFKERIRLSLSDKSTAGSERTYKSFALRADERVDDVAVYSPAPGKVDVVYYAKESDAIMKQRIEKALNAEDVRPLTDIVEVRAATQTTVDISATLTIVKGADGAKVQASAKESVEKIFARPQIGKDITLSSLIATMSVEGVEDVVITTPSSTVVVANDAVAVLGSVAITVQESSDVY